MKSESRVFNTLRRVVPSLLLTLAYAGVAQAQPIMPIAAPCTLPTDRTYRIAEGVVKTVAGGPSDTSFPYIKSSSPTSTWSLSPSSATPCDAGPVCVGLSVSTLSGTANRTEFFSGTAVAGSQKLNVTAGACTAEFTFMTTATGGGWGPSPGGDATGGAGGTAGDAGTDAGGTGGSEGGAPTSGGNDVGGQGGCTSSACASAGAGAQDMTTGGGGEGTVTNAGRSGGGTAGVGGNAAAGGALGSDAAGRRAIGVGGDADPSDAGDGSAADKAACDCAVPAGKYGGMQAWLVLGVSVAFAARRRSPRQSSMRLSSRLRSDLDE